MILIRPLIFLGFFLSLAFLVMPANAAESPNIVEINRGWQMTSASTVTDDVAPSQPGYDASRWYPIKRMPATVLRVLEDNGVYPDLYFGMNLAKAGDLWKQDWWYRTTFTASAGREVYSLIFEGINYRADLWVNGHKIANHSQIVGMYDRFELNVTEFVHPGENVLAVKITPERALTGEHGVELGDSWLDWINWKYLGYQDTEKHVDISFVPDRNAGVWKRVYLSSTGAVSIRHPYVATDLPLPATSPASLTVYCDVSNNSSKPVTGTISGEITRAGKPTIKFHKSVSLFRNEVREVAITPADFPALVVANPDLWWPYLWGKPNLYQVKLDFTIDGKSSDSQATNFGIRKITQQHDADKVFPELGNVGNFYLQINGRDYLIRGGVYAPDLLFRNDPERDASTMRYAKDLGLNLLRWELKIADDTMIERADREGMPVMLGWMCCAQWEHWDLWSAEDQWVARASLRARLRELRSHPSVVIWANGSDGLPPDPVLGDYHQIIRESHWQNAVVDTVSHVNRASSGIHMAGPYVWRPPYYWFSDKYGPARGSSAEEGDNETIPPLESLKKFIPADKLWPINEYWFFHSGANEGNNTLESVQRVLNRRYGPSNSAEEFSKKAQLAHYEDVRAQYETYATHWGNRKMTIHWMMNNPWPSLFGHLFDYYFKQGGGYFGAKKALQPLTVIWDYYATGDRSSAKVYVANQTSEPHQNLKVSLAFYNLDGTKKFSKEVNAFKIGAQTSEEAMSVGRIKELDPTYFVRCELRDQNNNLLSENVYWASATDDDLGDPKKDEQFKTDLANWADMSALNTMPKVNVEVSANLEWKNENGLATITLKNNSDHVAFFVRAELTKGMAGEEILPITYDDNYVTVFPHEQRIITANFERSLLQGQPPHLRVEGFNTGSKVSSFEIATQ